MQSIFHITTLLFLLVLSSTTHADVLRIPISQQGDTRIKMPAHGDQQAQVIQQFGEPSKRHPSIGQPPITRWDYSGFSVYFEQSTVVNSVQTHQPRDSFAP